ncbi:hypothetical protein Hamer_G015654 [Homarus americanus]|uniref:Uncharacterized protein n=1 Tax=Homarus americanus TaxID=6706 RepID=A0A8J5J9X0_HOMAM|nr:hypothetical protein Hamer_G015654 [Homarus americanus]
MSGYPQGTGSMGYWRSPAYVEKAAANIGQDPQGTGSMGYWRSPAYVEKAAANIGQGNVSTFSCVFLRQLASIQARNQSSLLTLPEDTAPSLIDGSNVPGVDSTEMDLQPTAASTGMRV